MPYASWLEGLWLAGAESHSAPLTPGQSRALWRRVIAESSEADELIGQDGVADWAAAAWDLLQRWRIEPGAERAGAGQLDYRALLSWCRAYRERLDAHGWIDRAELEKRLATAPPRSAPPAVMTDLAESHPARDALLKSLETAGATIGHETAPTVRGRQRTARLADAVDELRAALVFAQRVVTGTPTARVAVVVAGLAERQSEVARLIGTTFGETGDVPVWNGGQPLGHDAAIGAAFNALTLLSARTPYAAFGRWLCSRVLQCCPWRARCPRTARRTAADRIARSADLRDGVQALRSGDDTRTTRARVGRAFAQRVCGGGCSGARDTEPLGAPVDALSE